MATLDRLEVYNTALKESQELMERDPSALPELFAEATALVVEMSSQLSRMNAVRIMARSLNSPLQIISGVSDLPDMTADEWANFARIYRTQITEILLLAELIVNKGEENGQANI